MKPKQAKAIVKFAADIAATLKLDEWTIAISPSPVPEEEEAFAMVEAVHGRRNATLKLCIDFDKIGHKHILHVLVHEVCHLYFVDTKHAVEDLCELNLLGHDASALFQNQAHMAEELAVDRMAEAWADKMWEWESVQRALRKITKQVERTA